MAKKNKVKPNKNFRKESRKQENKMVALLAVGALILAVIVVLTNKIDFSKCSNTGNQAEIETQVETETQAEIETQVETEGTNGE